MRYGQCGEEFWIADELWSMATDARVPYCERKQRFKHTVMLLIAAGQPRKRRRTSTEKP